MGNHNNPQFKVSLPGVELIAPRRGRSMLRPYKNAGGSSQDTFNLIQFAQVGFAHPLALRGIDPCPAVIFLIDLDNRIGGQGTDFTPVGVITHIQPRGRNDPGREDAG